MLVDLTEGEIDDIRSMLAEGETAQETARRLQQPIENVMQIQQQMRVSASASKAVDHAIARHLAHTAPHIPSARPPVVAPAEPEPTTVTATSTDVTDDIFERAQSIDDAKIRRALTATEAARNRLVALVEEYEQRAEGRAEVARLEQELAAARAKLKTPKKTVGTRPATDVSVSHRDVRAWADSNGITVPDKGPVPKNVVEQYLASPAAAS